MEQSEIKQHQLLSEIDIISLMNEQNIGLNSWYYHHIQNILDRNYALINDNIIVPTPQGIKLIEIYQKFNIKIHDISLLSKIENELWMISNGEKSKENVISGIINEVSLILEKCISFKDQMINYLQENKEISHINPDSPKWISYVDNTLKTKVNKPDIPLGVFETDLCDTEFARCPKWK